MVHQFVADNGRELSLKAEHVVMVALMVLRNMNECQASVRRAGTWDRFNLAGNELMGKTFNLILRHLTGLAHRDTQCGFKLLDREGEVEIAAPVAHEGGLVVRAEGAEGAGPEAPPPGHGDAGAGPGPPAAPSLLADERRPVQARRRSQLQPGSRGQDQREVPEDHVIGLVLVPLPHRGREVQARPEDHRLKPGQVQSAAATAVVAPAATEAPRGPEEVAEDEGSTEDDTA